MKRATLRSLVGHLAKEDSERPALLDAEGVVTTRADLVDAVDAWAVRIEQVGLGGDDRIAVSLPNGVRMATAFLGIAANAVCAPLNPKYTDTEVEFYLTDLDAGLVVIDRDSTPGVRAVAERLGVPVLDLDAEATPPDPRLASSGGREPGDVSLILHTSGTTSRPKQVPLTHSNLLASAQSIHSTLGLESSDRCANVMPLFHIHGLVACLLASLHGGASVVCTAGFDPQAFLQTVARHRCSWYSAVPTIHQAVLSSAASRPEDASRTDLRFIRSSSSSLPPSVMGRLEAQFGVPVIEAYGMTEAAHQMASNQLPPGDRRPGSVGIAAGPDVSVVDVEGNHLPADTVGELVIRGDSIMSGYLSPPEANDDAFFGDWFRTGDQGTIDTGGVVTLTGRLKELINRAGEKIAPREIDEALIADADVSEALAFALPHPTLGEDVAAVVVPVDPGRFDEAGVLDRLRRRLSEHKVPRRLIVVDELPKGATGKPARIGLAERLGLDPPTTATATTEPASVDDPLVAAAAAVLGSVLGLSAVGPDDDFVAIGGDSLSALASAIAIEDTFGVSIPAGMLLGPAGSPTTLAVAIRSERDRDESAEILPESLSSAARRLWTMQQIDPSSTAYNVGIALRLRDGFGGAEAIEDAIRRLVERHAALRTLIGLADGEVHASPTAPMPGIDRRELTVEQIPDFVAEIMDGPIDLGLAPLHVGVGWVEDDDVVVVFTTHHALVDGPSRQIMRRDFVDLMERRSLPPVDEAVRRPRRVRAESTEFWRAELGDLPASPELPTPPPSSASGVERSAVSISGPVLEELRKLARSCGATLFSVLLAAHAEALRRVGGQDDVVIAVPVTSRAPDDAATVGMYIETVPVRVRLAGIDSVEALVREVHRAVTQALAHSDVPLEELIELASLHRSATARPLAGTMCQLRPPAPFDEGPTELFVEELLAEPSAARFDIAVDFIDRDARLEIVVEHDRAVMDDSQGRRHPSRIARVLDGFVSESSLAQIDVRSAEERTALPQVEPAEDDAESSGLDLVGALDELAAADPEATAIIDGDRTVTRGELDDRSHAFAGAFHEAGAGESRPVGIALPRGVDAIAAMIGAWRVGAPYVALDSSGPTEHARAVLERSGTVVVVTRTDGWDVPTIDPAMVTERGGRHRTIRMPSTAWMLSTSGSTGEPKLIPGSMAGLTNRLQWGQRTIPVTGPAAHRAPLVFADHVAEIFEPLLAGQPLVVVDDETVRDPRRLATLIEKAGVTRLLVVPTLLRMLMAGLPDGRQLTSLEVVVTSGEPLPQDVADDWLELVPQARLINIYGSTEVSADAAAGEVRRSGLVTVGSPIAGFRIQVVSSSGPPSPAGSVGEIWISGIGVMSGYVGQVSQDVLVERDLDGELRTWYRTGDRGRFDPEGQLVVLGRADRQLKVRGVRIDPTEIEAAIRANTGALDAAVFVSDDTLNAVLVGPATAALEARSVQRALAEALPSTHIPSRVQTVDELPRTSTGKLDRSALAPVSSAAPTLGRRPDSPTERWLAEQWSALIPDISELSVDDEFFSIGGQSLTAVELFVCIEQEFRVELPVSVIFDAPTIDSLASVIEAARGKPPMRDLMSVRQISAGLPGCPTVAWCLPGDGVGLRMIRDRLGPDIGLVALETPGLRRGERSLRRVEQIASAHARTVASLSLTGPLVIGGNSFGGLVALQLARRLRKDAYDPQLLVIVDAWPPGARPDIRDGWWWRQLKRTSRSTLGLARRSARHPRTHPWSKVLEPQRRARWTRVKRAAARQFTDVEPLDTPTLLFTTDQRRTISGRRDLGWSAILRGPLRVVELEGSHGGLLVGARGRVIGNELKSRLDALAARSDASTSAEDRTQH